MPEPFGPERWGRWKVLFNQAADLNETAQAELLDLHCQGDSELRQRFAAMFAAHRQSSAILDRSLPDRFLALSAGVAEAPPPPPPPLPPGTLLKDRYRLQKVIGRGGWSIVYLARDEQMQGRNVVIKQLLHEGMQRNPIDDEIAALSNLHHPGIATPLDAGAAPDGRRFLVLAYIPGMTLRACLQESGALIPGRAAKLLRAMGSALELAHAKGVCHLDLKPENIMLQGYGDQEDPVIVDFGISRLFHSKRASLGPPVGSLAYIAPEQLSGESGAGSDQYSLALVAAEMLTGRKPPPLASVSVMLEACGSLPPRARNALSRALSAAPANRFPDIGAFVATLAAAIDPDKRRYRRLSVLAVTAVAVVLITGAISLWLERRHEAQTITNDMALVGSQMAIWVRMADSSHFGPAALEEAFSVPLTRLQRLVAEGHREPVLLMTLSNSLALYGTYLGHPGRRNLGYSERSIAALRQSLDVAMILGDVAEDRRWWSIFTAEKCDMLASVLIEVGEYDQATGYARKGLALLDNYASSGYDNSGWASVRGGLLMTLSRVHFHRREFEECLRLRDQGVEIRRKVLPLYKYSRPARYDLAGVLATRGYLLRDMGRLDEAFRDYAESATILRALTEEESWNLQFRWLAARNAMEAGKLFLLKKEFHRAHAHLEKSAELMRGLLDDSRHEIASLRSYALCLSWFSVAKFRDGGKPPAIRALLDEALAVNQTAIDQDPASAKTGEERDLILQNARDSGILPTLKAAIPLH